MKITRIPFVLVLAAFFLTSFNATAHPPTGECAARVVTRLNNNATYKQLHSILTPELAQLKALLDDVKDQPTYESLLTLARTVATISPNGRLLVTLPDGTVVVDTSKEDDHLNTLEQGNSFKHFKDKTVNENHNTRIAILHSQLHVCGHGVETKLSTTDNTRESYVAIRLGAYLNNSGTARISLKL
jgi:hypothetical protein